MLLSEAPASGDTSLSQCGSALGSEWLAGPRRPTYSLGRTKETMKTTIYIAATLALTLASAGCATKKYVAKTIAPVEQRVSSTETKNTEQDQKITAQAGQLEAVDRDLSRTKERLTDTDAKATAAGARPLARPTMRPSLADNSKSGRSSAAAVLTAREGGGQAANR